MQHIPDGDFVSSATGQAIASGNVSIIGALGASLRPFLKSITLTNVHASADGFARILSGAKQIGYMTVPHAQPSVTRTWDEGIEGTAGDGIQVQILSASSLYVDAIAFKRS